MQRFRRRDKIVAALASIGVVAAVVVVRWTTDSSTSRPPDSRNRGEHEVPDNGSNPFRTGRTLVIPHGGGDGLFPENTLLAFERTIAMGADVVDVDLRLSQDGVVIVFHDATVDRITGATGSIRAMTFDQLSGLDAGWSFKTTGSDASAGGSHPYRGKNVTIPTFESILDEFPTTLVSVDLKDESLDMVQPVCDLLRDHRRFNDVFVGSNSDEEILELRRRCPDERTSAIMGDVYASRDARASKDPHFSYLQCPLISLRSVGTADSSSMPHRSNGRISTESRF